jgi:hypothetical protein
MRRLGFYAWLAVSILACKPERHAGTDRAGENASPAAEARGELTDDGKEERARRKDPAELAHRSLRLAEVIAERPNPFLGIRTTGGSMHPQVGKAVSLQIAVPKIQRWADAHVGQLTARLSGGVQEKIPLDRIDANGLLTYRFPTTGPAMLMFCAGPKSGAPNRSWFEVSHCSKILLDVTDARSRRDETGQINVTGETGLPIDIVPLQSPFGLATGDVLPVSFVVMNEEVADVEVAARRPDGSIDRQTTDASGIARFALSQAGRWIIRLVHEEDHEERVGELVFEIPELGR